MSPLSDSDEQLKFENHGYKESPYCSIPKMREHKKHIALNWREQYILK